jgi:hypothetical protein
MSCTSRASSALGMRYKSFFIFVEGDSDARFFEKILIPRLRSSYNHVPSPIQYSRRKPEYLDRYLKNIQGMNADGIGAHYLFIGDLDSLPCVTEKKQDLVKSHPRLASERIVVVKAEIESWYCAGITEAHAAFGSLKFARCSDTSEITKEDLADAVAPHTTRLDAMLELLEAFDPATAARRNESFRYFARKHLALAV